MIFLQMDSLLFLKKKKKLSEIRIKWSAKPMGNWWVLLKIES